MIFKTDSDMHDRVAEARSSPSRNRKSLGGVGKSMNVVLAKPEVADVIRQHGGSLFVWIYPHRCCSGSMTYLHTSPEPKKGRRFHRFDAHGLELWFDPGALNPPDELHLDIKGWRKKRVEAYWNGCAYAI